MHVAELQLTDFRSYPEVFLELDPGVTVIVGRNGRGKTNLVEAVRYLSTLSSHRVAADAPLTVTARVTNTGDRAGAEVVQVYLGVPVDGQPPKRLVGFAKTALEPGESATVEIAVDPAATHRPFSVWDYATGGFRIMPGEYTVFVGTSSEDTPHACTVAAP